ncbi:siderophore-interacting protein [Methylomonas sp. ZR1]|uniref:siderophore-interacting protein n=1 Tax=Methylomonas sp. ZR1 TaxID=1797072 RepID=UPI0014915F07|nr:siderophore-interacting protein [Methylomonas sp. ZR1]NOV29715.1 siderophore-interacting protein [Methylomonas sp. ZR1]
MTTLSTHRSRSTRIPQRLTVRETLSLGPRLRRIRFHGEALQDIVHAGPGAHLKLLLPVSGANSTDDAQWPDGFRSVARAYSLRRVDFAENLLDVDFVLHGDDGPGSRWAIRAAIGDIIGLAGVGGPPLSSAAADFHLLAGDLTALPAIAAVLETLPAKASGAALIEVPDAADQLALQYPPGVQLQWLHARASSPLTGAVRQIRWPAEARVFATIAGESASVLAIRQYLLRERGLSPASLYTVPYWCRGWSEEDYHDERHRCMDGNT